MTTPHSSWAEYYDTAYEQSFGDFYYQLTNATLKQIGKYVQPPARIIDFGAGTGRLSLPLASQGYKVVAVEPCKEMLSQLKRKSGSEYIEDFLGRMQDFRSNEQYDMAICIFTVLLYLLDEEALDESICAAEHALCPSGLLLMDIPSRATFQSYGRLTDKIERIVNVSVQGSDIYRYEETTTVRDADSMISYADSFPIRYWDVEHVMTVLDTHGFSLYEDLSNVFIGTGSQYFVMKKINRAEQGAPLDGDSAALHPRQ